MTRSLKDASQERGSRRRGRPSAHSSPTRSQMNSIDSDGRPRADWVEQPLDDRMGGYLRGTSSPISARISGRTSSGAGYLPIIAFVKMRSPFRWMSKMPPVPGTTSIDAMTGPQPARICATRLAAFGAAPQGWQYSMRNVCCGLTATRKACQVRSNIGDVYC